MTELAAYTDRPRSLSQSKGLVNAGTLAFTDPVVRQAHQPVQGDRISVIHIPCPVPEPVEGPVTDGS